MSRIISVSLSDDEYKDIGAIKEVHGFGASSIFKLGIKTVKEKLVYKIQKVEEELKFEKEANQKILFKLQNQARRIFDLENEKGGTDVEFRR